MGQESYPRPLWNNPVQFPCPVSLLGLAACWPLWKDETAGVVGRDLALGYQEGAAALDGSSRFPLIQVPGESRGAAGACPGRADPTLPGHWHCRRFLPQPCASPELHPTSRVRPATPLLTAGCPFAWEGGGGGGRSVGEALRSPAPAPRVHSPPRQLSPAGAAAARGGAPSAVPATLPPRRRSPLSAC